MLHMLLGLPLLPVVVPALMVLVLLPLPVVVVVLPSLHFKLVDEDLGSVIGQLMVGRGLQVMLDSILALILAHLPREE